MSPSWRDRLIAAIAPGQLQLQRLAPAWRGSRPLLAATADCKADESGNDDVPAWSSPLTTLRETLRDPQWSGTTATVVLSDHFVRYLLVPWDEQLVTDEEQLAMVRHAFLSAYGTTAEAWSFRWDAPPPPAPRLACAIDSGLLSGLRETFADASLALVSIQPRLMASFNTHHRELPSRGDYWFLAEESGRICLAWLHDEAPNALYSQRVDADWADDLPELLARGLLLAGAGSAPGAVYLHLATPREFASELPGGWSLHPLQPSAAMPR